MAFLHRTNSTRPFQILAIAAMILAIGPTAQAAPKMAQRVAMKDQPLCFVQLPGKTTNLDKLCGLGRKGGNTIDLDIDVNKDGISDQLLEATLQNQNFIEAETKRYLAKRSNDEQANQVLDKAYQAATTKANLQLQARLPFSNKAKQALAAQQRVVDEINNYQNRIQNAKAQKQSELLYAKLREVSKPLDNEPSLLRVQAAQEKVYAEIARRQTAK
jgi:hypothetical protein